MKIAVLFRGLVRPSMDINTIFEYRDGFLDFLKGYDVDNYLYTWDTPEANRIKHGYQNTHIEPVPSEEFITKAINHPNVPPGNLNWHHNYKQFYTMKRATEWVANHGQYDYVFQTRVDVVFKIDNPDYLKEWIEYPEWYTTIHTPERGVWNESEQKYVDWPIGFDGRMYLNDQVGGGSPEMMKKAWDYRGDDILKPMFHNSAFSERVLEKVMAMNGVNYRNARATFWGLNGDRHKYMQSKDRSTW